MVDKIGQELSVGDNVDLFLAPEMMSAIVAKIEEGGLIDPSGRPTLAALQLTIPVVYQITPGAPAPVYRIRKAKEVR